MEAGVDSGADQLLSEPERGELRSHANLIWGIAELLRGDYKRADYAR